MAEKVDQIKVLISFRWWFRPYLLLVAVHSILTGNAPKPNDWVMKRAFKCETVKSL